MGWNGYIGSVWQDVFTQCNMSRFASVVEVAPGGTDKIGLGLQGMGFRGTLFLVEPNAMALQQTVVAYRRLLPDASIVPILAKLDEATSRIGPVDAIVANHPLDDMLIAESVDMSFFDDHYAAPAEATDRAWHGAVGLDRAKRKTVDAWSALVNRCHPSLLAISQYRSHFFRSHGLDAPDRNALEVLSAMSIQWHRRSLRLDVDEPNRWLVATA